MPRRHANFPAAAGMLMASLVIVLAGCVATGPGPEPSGCACTHPGPSGTPWPVSQDAASATATRFAGVGMADDGEWTILGAPVYVMRGNESVVVVDGRIGRVIQFFRPDAIPKAGGGAAGGGATATDATASPGPAGAGVTPTVAEATARTFLEAHGIAAEGPAASPSTAADPNGAAFIVSWRSLDGGPETAGIRVWVDVSSGVAYAYSDGRSGLDLAPPVVGRQEAIDRAIAETGVAGEQVSSADLRVEFLREAETFTWDVGLGIPHPDPSGGDPVWFNSFYMTVDATTGTLEVVKR